MRFRGSVSVGSRDKGIAKDRRSELDAARRRLPHVRLQVPMHDPALVRVLPRLGDLLRHAERLAATATALASATPAASDPRPAQHAQRVDVDAGVDVEPAHLGLLRAHVLRCADEWPDLMRGERSRKGGRMRPRSQRPSGLAG